MSGDYIGGASEPIAHPMPQDHLYARATVAADQMNNSLQSVNNHQNSSTSASPTIDVTTISPNQSFNSPNTPIGCSNNTLNHSNNQSVTLPMPQNHASNFAMPTNMALSMTLQSSHSYPPMLANMPPPLPIISPSGQSYPLMPSNMMPSSLPITSSSGQSYATMPAIIPPSHPMNRIYNPFNFNSSHYVPSNNLSRSMSTTAMYGQPTASYPRQPAMPIPTNERNASEGSSHQSASFSTPTGRVDPRLQRRELLNINNSNGDAQLQRPYKIPKIQNPRNSTPLPTSRTDFSRAFHQPPSPIATSRTRNGRNHSSPDYRRPNVPSWKVTTRSSGNHNNNNDHARSLRSSRNNGLARASGSSRRSRRISSSDSSSSEEEEDAKQPRSNRVFDFKSFTWFAEKIRSNNIGDFEESKKTTEDIAKGIPNTDDRLGKSFSRLLLLSSRPDIVKRLMENGQRDVGGDDASWSELEDKVKRLRCRYCKFYDHSTRDCTV